MPAEKHFLSEHGKGMELHPENMGLYSGQLGKLCLDDLTGANLTSGKNLILYAKGSIRLDSGEVIDMETLSGIFAEALAAATSSMCVNGRFDYLSAGTLLKGSIYLAYDPFDDAPKEGKFDWGGLLRNFAIGFAVFAVCAAFAVASVLSAGAVTVAGGALIGAAIGALTTTISISVEDFNSGNVRSAGDAMLQIGMSAISGAITGAIGAKFPNMNKLLAGLIDTAVGTFERGVVAAVTEDMTFGEWLAYTFNPGTILLDFAAGVLIDFAIDGIAKFFKGKEGAQLADGIADQLSEGVEDGVNRELRDSLGDAVEDSAQRAARETVEDSAQRAAREAAEETAEKTARETTSDDEGVRTNFWTGYIAKPRLCRYSHGLLFPSDILILFVLYHIRYLFSMSMNSGI